MDFKTAQSELRKSYVHGGPGAVVSGFVWLIAGATATAYGISYGFAALFFGGMLIFPIATLVVRAIFQRSSPAKENPGGLIVVETVFPMIGGLFAAWLLLPHRPDFVFPMAAIAVGAHYFGFRTAYGDATYWVLGAIMCGIGAAAIATKMPTSNSVPYLIAVVEIAFGLWLSWIGMHRKTTGSNTTGQA